MKVGHPVRWIEDRREHLLASVHCRDHFYNLTIAADRDGTLLGIEGDVYIDAGAYSLWPTGSFMEASMASRNLTGPYRIRHLNLKTYTVATNKAPMGPYRGVARPGACFAIERLVDEVARELKREPFDLRRQNIVTVRGTAVRDRGGHAARHRRLHRLARHRARDDRLRRRSAPARTRASPTAARSAWALRSTPSRAATASAEWVKRKSRVAPGYEVGQCADAARRLADRCMSACKTTARATRRRCRRSRRMSWRIDPVADLGALRRHRHRAVRLRHLRLALHRVCRRRGRPHLPNAGRKDPADRRAPAANRRRQHAHRGRRGARSARQRQLRRDRLRRQRPAGAPAGRHGPAARCHRDLRAEGNRRRVRLRHPCRRGRGRARHRRRSRSSTTRCRRTAAR